MRSAIFSGTAALIAAQLVSAQTYTSCNPTTNSSCPSDTALGKTITVDFTQGSSDYFTEATGTSLTYDATNGASFVMEQEGQAPTITSNFYIFFGKVTVEMQAANGTGVVSSFVMESDDLDEIDWEWLGGDTTQVESNYFGKGNTTTYDRAIYHDVTAPQSEFHTYTIEWSNQSIIWSIDGTEVRTLLYTDAVDGKNFPQTPMVIKMGNWDGGASTENEGTIEWAGGLTDWTTKPFTMYVKSVTIEDANTGATSYTYGDMTGSYESIEISDSGSVSASASASASATATASGSAVSRVATSAATASGSSTTESDKATSSGSSPVSTSTSDPSPPFQNPAPKSNSTSSSNLTSTATPTGSSSSSSSSSTTASASVALETTNGAGSKYGSLDVAVLVLGISLGYFFM